MVLESTEETAMEKKSENEICLSMQVISTGRPRKKKTQRKLSRREPRSVTLTVRLLALTIGVSQCKINNPMIKPVTTENNRTNPENTKAKISNLYDRNSYGLGRHFTFLLSGQ